MATKRLRRSRDPIALVLDAQSSAEAARIVMTSRTSDAATKSVNQIITLLTVA